MDASLSWQEDSLKGKLKTRLGSLIALVVALALVPSAASADDSENYTYNGVAISAEDVDTQELSCVMNADVNECFDTVEEADASTHPEEEGTASRVVCSVRDLFEWKLNNYSGSSISLGPNHVGTGWTPYNASNAATTTSFRTGDYEARFNGHRDGGGANYPDYTGPCSSIGNLAGSGWDDRFRTRKRIP